MILSGKAKLAGVMGWPVSHSRSPRLHGYWLDHYGIDGAYLPLAVAPARFEQALRALPVLGFRGANVTIPHKEEAFRLVDHRTTRAEQMGAVNTVVVQEEGLLLGDNTDGFGFIENLRAGLPDWQPEAAQAVILGAGGAARGICVSLLEVGVPRLVIVNRTLDRAQALAESLDPGRIGAAAWSALPDLLPEAGLLVNTTSLGMAGQPPLEIDLAPLPLSAAVTDIVYAPLMTALLRQAQFRGHAVVDGLGMLLHQARPGFQAWFGPDPAVTAELHAFVAEGL